MKVYFLLIFINLFSCHINKEGRLEIEKADNNIEFQDVLNALDSEELYQSIPEDIWGRIPPQGYENNYPHRVKFRQLQLKLDSLLTTNLSKDVLIQTLDTIHYRKLNYEQLVDKLMKFKSDSLNLKIYSYVTSQNVKEFYKRKKIEFVIKRLEDYVIDKFANNHLLIGEYKEYVIEHKKELILGWKYLGHIDKGIDIQIIQRKLNVINLLKKDRGEYLESLWTTIFQEKYLNTFFPDNKRESFYFHWRTDAENAISDLEIVKKQLLTENLE